jgi:hypothetical protein
MTEIEDESGDGEESLQDILDALDSDDQIAKMMSGKVKRTSVEAGLCLAVREIAFRDGGGWPRFLKKRAEIDRLDEPEPAEIRRQRGKMSAQLNGRTGHPYPTQAGIVEIVRVALHDASPEEREAAIKPVRVLWKEITGGDLDLGEKERRPTDHESETARKAAQALLMSVVGAQGRAEKRADAAEIARRVAEAQIEVLTGQVKELKAENALLTQREVENKAAQTYLEIQLRQLRDERDAEKRAALAAQDRLGKVAKALEVETRQGERARRLADARAERYARMVAIGVAEGRAIDWRDLAAVGLRLDIFPRTDRNHKAICAYLQIRWQLIRHNKVEPTPLPADVNAEMLDRAYRGQGALLPWQQFTAVVESIGGQPSFLNHFYRAVKAEETPVDPLRADFDAIMGQAEIPGLTEEVEPTEPAETTGVDRPRRKGRLRAILTRLLRRRRGRPGRPARDERPDGSATGSTRQSRREDTTQRHLYH